jgi:hypothetical protein
MVFIFVFNKIKKKFPLQIIWKRCIYVWMNSIAPARWFIIIFCWWWQRCQPSGGHHSTYRVIFDMIVDPILHMSNAIDNVGWQWTCPHTILSRQLPYDNLYIYTNLKFQFLPPKFKRNDNDTEFDCILLHK